MRFQIGSCEYLNQKKKSYWSLKVSSELKKCEETMTNEESENDGGMNR